MVWIEGGKERGLIYWLALGSIPGIGPHTYKALIERFGSPEEVFNASTDELLAIEGIGRETAKRIGSFRGWRRVEEELEVIKRKGIGIVTLMDRTYPANLKEIYDPPPYLYIKGELKGEDERAIAIVGSRTPTPYGLGVAYRMAMELASCGFTIVSGMARGIDSEAHRGALKAGGRTIAVLGSGIDVIYPPEGRDLYHGIVESGAVISEFPLSTPPYGRNFPKRNRIISGLSLGVLVVEASLRSGSLITARLALEQGREVFAVPGSITSGRSRGTNLLIKEGAKLVEDVDDVLGEVSQWRDRLRGGVMDYTLTEKERIVYNSLEEPVHIDMIIKKSGLRAEEVSSLLLGLEAKGLIVQHPGKVFSRR